MRSSSVLMDGGLVEVDSDQTGVNFTIKGQNEAILLIEDQANEKIKFRIAIGASQNTVTWLGQINKKGMAFLPDIWGLGAGKIMLEKIGISPTKSKSEIERNIADFFDVTKCVHQIEILFIHMRMCYKIAKSTLEGKIY